MYFTIFVVILQISCIRPLETKFNASDLPAGIMPLAIKHPKPVFYPQMSETLSNPNFIRDRVKLYLRPILPPAVWERYKTKFTPVWMDYCDQRHCNAYHRRVCGVNLEKRSWKWFQSGCHLKLHNMCTWYRGTLKYQRYNTTVCHSLERISMARNGCPDCVSDGHELEYDDAIEPVPFDEKLEGSNFKLIMLYLLPSGPAAPQNHLREDWTPVWMDYCDPRHCNAYHKRACGVNYEHRAWRWFQSGCHIILHNKCTWHTANLPYVQVNNTVCYTLEKHSDVREGCQDCEPDGAPVCAVRSADNRVALFKDQCALQKANCRKENGEYERVKLGICIDYLEELVMKT